MVNPEKAVYILNMANFFRCLALILIFNACSTPFRFVVPVLRFQSPEVNGPDKNWSFTGGLESYNDVEITPSVSTTPIHNSPSTFRQRFLDRGDDELTDALFNYSYLHLNLGYRPAAIPVEFFLTFPSTLGAKIQLLGANAEDAKAGNLSLAITGAWASRGVKGGTSITETPEPGFWEYTFEREIYDVSAILGYRIQDNILLYGGAFLYNSPYRMTQNLAGSTGNQATIIGTANSYGGNFGAQFGAGRSTFKIETAFNKLKAYQNEEQFVHIGLAWAKRF